MGTSKVANLRKVEKFYNLPFNFSRGSFYLGYKGEMHQI
jgi:hypothetical protein